MICITEKVAVHGGRGHRHGHHGTSSNSETSHTSLYYRPGFLGGILSGVNHLAHGVINLAGKAVTGTEQTATNIARTVTAGIPGVNNLVEHVTDAADDATTGITEAAANTAQNLVVGATGTANALTGGGVVAVHRSTSSQYRSHSSSSSTGYHH